MAAELGYTPATIYTFLGGHTMETMGQAAGAAVALQQGPACPTCGEAISRQFCPACGEQKFKRDHFAFKHLLHEIFHEFANFDSKIFRTARYLFTRPGYIAEEYLAGKRSRYVKPLRTYLFCFALAIFLYSFYRPVFDVGELARAEKTGQIHQALVTRSHKLNISEEKLIQRVNERWSVYMEFVRIPEAFIMVGLLAAVYHRRQWYLAEHAVVALYFLSFACLLDLVLWPLHIATGGGLASNAKSIVFFLVAVPYMWMMLRRVYKDPPGKTTFKTLVVYVTTQIGMQLIVLISLIFAVARSVR
jgi:Protein of unknown function (DUF3667)